MDQVLDNRALNRALLSRQMLLERAKLPVLDALERLVGMQAQSPSAPYYSLWTRLSGFHQKELSQLIQNKSAVRIALMRSTLHLVSAADCFTLRTWMQPVHERSLKGTFGKKLDGVDVKRLASLGRSWIETKPSTLHEIGEQLKKEWPDHDQEALSAAVRSYVPLVQTPPRGLWGESGQAVHTSAEVWLGQPPSAQPEERELILRYLAAYGPATIKDIQAWSGLTRLRATVEHLRPVLVTFRDDQGNELFDLPDAPRPVGDTPSPPRFLGEFDNVLLSHANRSRLLDESHRKQVFTINGIVRSTILLDGFVAGTWRIQREHRKAQLIIEPFRRLSRQECSALAEEGLQLLHFAVEEGIDKGIKIHHPH